MKELEDRFGLLFDKLKVGNTKEIVSRTVKPVNVKKEIPESLQERTMRIYKLGSARLSLFFILVPENRELRVLPLCI